MNSIKKMKEVLHVQSEDSNFVNHHEFYLDGEKILTTEDVFLKSTDGEGALRVLHELAIRGVLKLESKLK